jgi:multidrug efflux pump subunit AcrA (membrane-fusion protein)/rubrerythrin
VKISTLILVLLAVALAIGGTALSLAGDAPGKTLYTCGMHPQVIQDHPGNCPICGMKLTPIRQDTGAENSTGSAVLAVDAAARQNMNLRTATLATGPLHKVIRTVGTIDYNETALADVTTKFKGWIEKLDVDATGELVHRGEPMFEIYSPDLYSAEAEYLLALHGPATNDPGAAELRETATTKLKFFDVPDSAIASLAQSGTPLKTMPVYAPISGFVIEKNVVQGQMVDAGMKLYRIADLAVVWVIAEIYEQDLPFVQLGQEAVVKAASLPDREFRGRVTYVYPTVDEKTRTARVRLEFENPGYFLKPGMFVSAEIQADLPGPALLVPDAAVLRSGARNTVFVALAEGRFEPREVTLGVEAEDSLIQVLSGLQAGDRIVTSGQFLLDSESQLREAIDKMQGQTPAGTLAGTAASPTNGQPAVFAAPSEPETTVYVCPMPEHVSIVYDHPGNCPICGMALVPVTPSALKKIQPGGKVLYYVCPMPEHANVHQDKPGKCPLCGMTLVPVMSKPAPAVPAATRATKKYFCPMHPEVVSDHPGKCPKCGMDLMPVE